MAMLEVNHLAIQFGGLRAVDGFNVSIEKGQLYGLIGPNGAGKTTIFNLLTGVYKPTEGIIKLDGQDITGKSTIEINKAGIARTFQNIRLFKDMPVLDNVKVGLHNHHKYSTLTGILRLPKYYKVEKEMNEKAMEILDEAGIVDTDGDGIRELDGENINLRYISYENRLLNDFSDAHAQYLAEIGIGVIPEYGSSDDQWSKLAALDYDFNNNNWTTVGTGDPFAYMANWATDTTYCAYSNPEYDELYEQLKGEMDPEARKDLIFKMQQILIDDAAVLVDGYYNSSMIYSKKVASAHIHTADYYWLSTEIVPAE